MELRTDAIKICVEMQRPTPWRADTIGPWLDSLSFLTWLGSLTTSALVYLFSNDGLGPGGHPKDIKAWALLLTIFFSEHIFLVVRWAVQVAISKLDSPGLQKEKRERYAVRKRYFDESLSELAKFPTLKAVADGSAEITRASLEDDARTGSLQTSTSETRFWGRQKGWSESAKVGASIIERAAPDEETKKAQ
jgi:anoctamin-10